MTTEPQTVFFAVGFQFSGPELSEEQKQEVAENLRNAIRFANVEAKDLGIAPKSSPIELVALNVQPFDANDS